MNEAETTMETGKTPNRIEGSDLERKTGGADMETAGGDRSLPGGGMEQARSDDEGLAPPVPDDRHAEEDAAIKAHFDRIWQEAEAFSREVPGFDLAAELADDGFAALLSPARGLTLEQAYFVRHGRELLSAAERAAEARVSAALGSAAAAPAVRWDAADARTREALKARIRKGEKIYPGR